MSVLQLKLNTAINTMKQNRHVGKIKHKLLLGAVSVRSGLVLYLLPESSRLNKAGTEGLSDLCKEAFDPSGKLRQPITRTSGVMVLNNSLRWTQSSGGLALGANRWESL